MNAHTSIAPGMGHNGSPAITDATIKPQPGPQTKFLSSAADIAIYGGGAGGGKTWGLLMEPLRHVSNPGFGAVFFRRTTVQIRNEGGLWDESATLYPQLAAEPKEHELWWRFPSGAAVSFAHLEHDKTRFNYQGAQIPLICFDELPAGLRGGMADLVQVQDDGSRSGFLMPYDLTALVRRLRNPRRKQIVIRDIRPPQMLANDLYRSTYAKVCGAWESAIPRVMAEYERSLPVRDSIRDSAADLGDLFSQLGDELTRIILDLIPELRNWTVRTDRWHRDQWRGAVLSATGVDIETILYASGTPQSVGQTIAWNTALIRDVSDQTRQRISTAVFAGLQARKPARDVAAEIRQAVAMSRRRSINIASDQLAKLASGLDTERMHDAGISRFKYRHSGKVHARKWHQARNGHLYGLETRQEVDGSDQIATDDMSGIPPWCGCRKQAVLTFD